MKVMGVDKQLIVGKGCLNKEKVCTARFPRKISKVTVVDKEGHIHLMKNEPNINTVNDVMVYCFGCNTDCSSLSSGTAVKATAGYIADYICKMGLKTYQIFSSIYDVFERNPDVWVESKSENDAARQLIMKMANSLTSKIEIGGPMAAMYVVYVQNEWAAAEEASRAENPRSNDGAVDNSFPVPVGDDIDHEMEDVEPCFDDGGDEDEEDSVAIKRTAVCLYDWIQCSVRKSVVGVKNPSKTLLCYQRGHPLFKSHRIAYDVRRMQTVVPNFLGAYLPRPDGDDREYYCCTILTLFVPWRSPLDLKSSCESWDAAFDRYSFSDRHS